MTQFALGELINLDQRQIAYIEGGNSFPSLKTLLKFTNIFECKIKDFFDWDEYIEQPNIKCEIKKEVDKLSENELKFFYKVIDAMKNYSS